MVRFSKSARGKSARGRTGIIAAAAVALVGAGALGAAAATSGPPTKAVTFHGVRLEVPESWPVIDLTSAPRTCVRFDRHAVYLGHPGTDQQCPSHLTGRSDALLIEPLDGATGLAVHRPDVEVPAGASLPRSVARTAGGVTSLALRGPGVLVTAAYPGDPGTVSGILATAAEVASGASSSAPVRAAAVPFAPGRVSPRATTSVEVPGTYNGLGFDACEAPSQAAMDAWRTATNPPTPYHAVAVYLGGVNRACAQPNLTADWVSTQMANDWHVMPLYVGLQAPTVGSVQCAAAPFGSAVIDPAQAAKQGTDAANDAADAATALGMAAGSVITYDMESYTRNATCSPPVLTFLSAWTTQLHARGYRSSVYSSATSAIADLVGVYNTPGYARPDQIFDARWDGVATTAEVLVPNEYWSAHQRAKQYQGSTVAAPIRETYGGVTIEIDRDVFDVAAQGPVDVTPPSLGFAAPAVGAKLRGVITVTPTVSDPSGINRVELYVNGRLAAVDRAAPWSLTWPSGATNARVTLGLRAYDQRGNAAPVLVQRQVIVDNTAPALRISGGPANNAKVRGTVTLTAAASDANGVARVELWINGKRVAVDAAAPYRFPIVTTRYGRTLKLQLRAFDQAGNVTAVARTWRR